MTTTPATASRRPPTNARTAAFLCLIDVERGHFPENALETVSSRLSRKDRALATAIVYGVLRWRSRLEWIIRHYLAHPGKPLDPKVRLILDIGAYQILYMDRIPVSAAVNESVLLARHHGPPWSPKFVNAVLRSLTRNGAPPEPENSGLGVTEILAVGQSHPEWMVKRWVGQIGLDETKALLAANNRQAPLTLRVNTRRISRGELAEKLSRQADLVRETAYSPDGLILEGPTGPVTDLPGFADGLFAVQDEAAQLVGFLAGRKPGQRVLDACAGVGGKTMHLAAMTNTPVHAADIDSQRLGHIPAEARRLGLPAPVCTQADLTGETPYEPGMFDVVVVDAPCSNLGVIRRRPDIKWLKAEDSPRKMAELQARLLHAASVLVKPGGKLVYAVCSLTTEETTGVTDEFWMNHLEFGLKPVNLFLPESAHPLASPDGVLRAWPHRHGTDGFFAAVFEKKFAKPPDFPEE